MLKKPRIEERGFLSFSYGGSVLKKIHTEGAIYVTLSLFFRVVSGVLLKELDQRNVLTSYQL